MLFQDQLDFFGVKQGDVPYVTAAFIADNKTVGQMISYRRAGQILVTVAHYTANELKVKLITTLSPAHFEEFYAEFQKAVESDGGNVVEFNYRTRTIDDPHTSLLEEEEQNTLTAFFLEAIAEGYDRGKVYEAVVLKAREMRAQMQ